MIPPSENQCVDGKRNCREYRKTTSAFADNFLLQQSGVQQ